MQGQATLLLLQVPSCPSSPGLALAPETFVV